MINNANVSDDEEIFYGKYEYNDTLIIDAGTHKCKAGFKNKDPQIMFKTKLYKIKNDFFLNNKPQSSRRSMFDRDVIINCEILEATVDFIFEYLLFNNCTGQLTSQHITNDYSRRSDERRKRRKSENSYLFHDNNGSVKVDVPENLILTLVLDTPKFFKAQLLAMLFEVYGFKKIQFGFDCFYSYLFNIKKDLRANSMNGIDYDLAISLSNMNIFVLLISDEMIIRYWKIPYGAHLAAEYLQAMIQHKYHNMQIKLPRKECQELLKFVNVAEKNYNEGIMKIYDQMKLGYFEYILPTKILYMDEQIEPKKKVIKREKLVKNSQTKISQKDNITDSFENDKLIDPDETKEQSDMDLYKIKEQGDMDKYKTKEQGDIDLYKQEESAITSDLQDNMQPKISTEGMTENEKMYFLLEIEDSLLTKEQLKEKRRFKIIYYSSIFRYKQKIEKEIKKLLLNIEHDEEELEKLIDMSKYLEKIKNRYTKTTRELKIRENTKRALNNKKSKENMIIMKVNNGLTLYHDEENVYKNMKGLEDEEMEKILSSELQKCISILNIYDPNFLIETSPISLTRNEHYDIGGVNIDLELLKIGEIIFEPGLIGIKQPGLSEIFDFIRELKIRNILLTGGFSQIKNLELRIENEMNQKNIYNSFVISHAENPHLDSFKGACLCDAFPIFTLNEFLEIGAEKLIEKYDNFC